LCLAAIDNGQSSEFLENVRRICPQDQAGSTTVEYHQRAVSFNARPAAGDGNFPVPPTVLFSSSRADFSVVQLERFATRPMRLRFLPTRFSSDRPSGLPAPDELHGKPRPASAGTPAKSAPPNDKTGRESAAESATSAQPSPQNRVPEDMASLVMDNPGLNSGRNAALGLSASTHSARTRPEAGAAVAEQTDAEIMLAVAAGDEAGYNYLVGKYHRQIIHFLFRMVRNEAVAEELAQEVFLRVYRSRESYRAEAKFSTWLYRIATNLAVNHARDTKYERTAPTLELDAPDTESGATPEVADSELNIEQRMMREERMAAIRAQVSALPERQRMAVLMHKYQEMDYRQIGEVLKLSESATKSLLFRAYQTLRDRLKDFV
jgi:RNA polymerase sigma-70 factor, ECF subfamily